MKKIILCVSALFLLCACTSNNGKYAAISNQPLNLFNLVGNKSILAKGVEGESSRSIFIAIPSDDTPSIDEAITNALLKQDGDYLTNATVSHTSFHILWLYHYSSWKVKGDVVKIYR